jgi:DNA-binding IclR family transcriptional regulator
MGRYDMAGIDRYTRILDLFTEERGIWTITQMSGTLGTSASTLYRLVREMVGAGFLESTVDAQFRLGPAFVNYDRRMRLTDPLIRSGAKFLQPLVGHIDIPATAILARLFGKTVMCVDDARNGTPSVKVSFERGRPMPLTRGATSRAILANVESRRLKRLLEAEGHLDDAARIAFTDKLGQLRREGYVVAHGEVDKGAVGLAVPLSNRGLGIDASLSIIVAERDLTEQHRGRILALLATNAKLIETFMEEARSAMVAEPVAEWEFRSVAKLSKYDN